MRTDQKTAVAVDIKNPHTGARRLVLLRSSNDALLLTAMLEEAGAVVLNRRPILIHDDILEVMEGLQDFLNRKMN